jgi:TM2 domain-containing membrane protein YozV
MPFCPKCGNEYKEDLNFCSNCGYKLNPKEKDWMSDDLHKFSSTDGENVSPKSRAVAAILAYFVGGFGAHNFYLGKTGQGIVMAIFWWTFIPSIVAFVQFIIILCGSETDSNGLRVTKW